MLESLKPASASLTLMVARERQRHDQNHRHHVHVGTLGNERGDRCREQQKDDSEFCSQDGFSTCDGLHPWFVC